MGIALNQIVALKRELTRLRRGARKHLDWRRWEFRPLRAIGRDWPAEDETMIGQVRLDHLHQCVEQVLEQGVPGDLMEAGVWRGGACILMRAVLKAFDDRERIVWAADSFAGMPTPDGRYAEDAGDTHWKHNDVLAV